MRTTSEIELLESSVFELRDLSSSLFVTLYVLVVGAPDLDSVYDFWFALETSLGLFQFGTFFSISLSLSVKETQNCDDKDVYFLVSMKGC